MSTVLLVSAATASGLVAIASDWRGQRRAAFYVAKPLTTVLIALLAWVSLASLPVYRGWVMAALVCCLAGDVALLFSAKRAFLGGLASFLVGHLLFVAAFLTELPLAPVDLPLAVWLLATLFLLAVTAYASWLLPRTGALKPAVLAYLVCLTLMVLAALLYAGLAERAVPRWAAVGALLFAVSDAVLAYRKFVAQPWWGQPLTLLTYYLAIGLIAWAH